MVSIVIDLQLFWTADFFLSYDKQKKQNQHEDNEENNKKRMPDDKAIYEHFPIKFDYVCIWFDSISMGFSCEQIAFESIDRFPNFFLFFIGNRLHCARQNT